MRGNPERPQRGAKKTENAGASLVWSMPIPLRHSRGASATGARKLRFEKIENPNVRPILSVPRSGLPNSRVQNPVHQVCKTCTQRFIDLSECYTSTNPRISLAQMHYTGGNSVTAKKAKRMETALQETTIQKCMCLRCGHQWFPSKPGRPRTCANKTCRSAYWDAERIRKPARRTAGKSSRRRSGKSAVAQGA